MTRINPSMFAN